MKYLRKGVEGHPNSGKRIFLFKILFLLSGCVLFFQACDTAVATKESENMAMTKLESTVPLEKPPVDLSAPAETETATFALG